MPNKNTIWYPVVNQTCKLNKYIELKKEINIVKFSFIFCDKLWYKYLMENNSIYYVQPHLEVLNRKCGNMEKPINGNRFYDVLVLSKFSFSC